MEILEDRKIYWVNEQYRLDAFYDRSLYYRIRISPVKSKAYYKHCLFYNGYGLRGKVKPGKYTISSVTTTKSHETYISRYTYVVSKKQIIKYLLDKRIR